jgi:monovalent cation:H+ antiporter-2, CPA2 family
VTLGQLAVTVALLATLGLAAGRAGLSPIPAYLVAGLLLGPNEPRFLSFIHPSDVTEFVAELGIVFLLFFLGLEFSLGRLLRSGRHLMLGGATDLVVNGLLGLVIGLAAFGAGFAAIMLAAGVYVSSSAIIVKGMTDFRRLADDETDLVLAVLIFEDLVVALVLGFAAGGGGGAPDTLVLAAKAIGFVAAALAASRWLSGPLDRALDWLPREFFLLFTFALLIGMSALAAWLGLSEAIGALMAGVMLAETSVREEIEERYFSFRDLFAALFFFVFGLEIDVAALDRVGWLVAVALGATLAGKLASGFLAARLGGFSRRQGLNAGAALIAHGEFTVIIAKLASDNPQIGGSDRADLLAFAGLYVLVTATIGTAFMKESKRVGRRLFPPVPRLAGET